MQENTKGYAALEDYFNRDIGAYQLSEISHQAHVFIADRIADAVSRESGTQARKFVEAGLNRDDIIDYVHDRSPHTFISPEKANRGVEHLIQSKSVSDFKEEAEDGVRDLIANGHTDADSLYDDAADIERKMLQDPNTAQAMFAAYMRECNITFDDLILLSRQNPSYENKTSFCDWYMNIASADVDELLHESMEQQEAEHRKAVEARVQNGLDSIDINRTPQDDFGLSK